jgi:tetratricopeptide (TPR) repeat protein
MNTDQLSQHIALCPRHHANEPNAPALQMPGLGNARLISVDADFESGGTWAGAAALVELAFHECAEAGLVDLLQRHNYELYMALPGLRDRIPLINGCLTDLAEGLEKTRNYALDRAYRIAHGLVDFLLGWRARGRADDGLLVIVVDRLANAQHLGQRFFLELARRGTATANLLVVVPSADANLPAIAAAAPRLAGVPIHLAGAPARLDDSASRRPPIATEAEAEESIPALLRAKTVEIESRRLRAYYTATGNDFAHAQASLAAMSACNHFGYYHEARAFLPDVMPYFEQIAGDDEEKRWNYTGNIYHSLLVTGAPDEARHMVETLAQPHISRVSLLARMEYVFGIHELRFSTQCDLGIAEKHLVAATQLMAACGDDLPAEEVSFLRVFIDNGLALLRVRQGRKSEAIALCQAGFKLLDEALGPQMHKLHRSVLQYNTAQVYNMMGEVETALAHYEQAISMDPNYSEYYNDMGNIFQRQGRFDDALAAYEKAVRLSPPYAEVHFNLGLCWARRGDWQAAMAECRRSLELNPDQLDTQLVLGEIYQQLDQTQDALGCYEHAIEIDPVSVVAHVNKAVTLFNMDRFAESLVAIDAAIALDPNEPGHFEKRANILRSLEQRENSADDAQTAKRLLEAA